MMPAAVQTVQTSERNNQTRQDIEAPPGGVRTECQAAAYRRTASLGQPGIQSLRGLLKLPRSRRTGLERQARDLLDLFRMRQSEEAATDVVGHAKHCAGGAGDQPQVEP